MGLASFFGSDASHHIGTISNSLLGVERAGLAREALADDARVLVDPDLRVLPSRARDATARRHVSPTTPSTKSGQTHDSGTGCGPWPWPRAGARRAATRGAATAWSGAFFWLRIPDLWVSRFLSVGEQRSYGGGICWAKEELIACQDDACLPNRCAKRHEWRRKTVLAALRH